MGLFNRKKKELAECTGHCEEADRRECDECLLTKTCTEVYKNTDHAECWKCRYQKYEEKKCMLRYKED